MFDFLPCKYTPTERFNDQETRLTSNLMIVRHGIQSSTTELIREDVVKLLNGSTRRQRVTTDKRDKMYWSVFVDCCRAAKMPKKVIAANPAACRAPQLLLGERYERQWCGRGDATFRDFLRRSARKLGHCGRHTAPMQPAMIIRHFGDWATCPSPSSPGFLHAQNIDRGQYMRWRSRFRNPKLGYWSTPCNCIVQNYHKSFSCGKLLSVVSYGSGMPRVLGGLKRIILMGLSHCVAFSPHFWATFIPILNTQWRRNEDRNLCRKNTLSCSKKYICLAMVTTAVLCSPRPKSIVDKITKQTGRLAFCRGDRVLLKTSF